MKTLILSVAMIAMCSANTFAQQRGNRSRAGAGMGPGSPGSLALERAGLEVGQPMPNITIHDDRGADVQIGGSRENYTVIVFGCLT